VGYRFVDAQTLADEAAAPEPESEIAEMAASAES